MIVGGAMILTWLLVALFAPVVAPFNPIKVNVVDSLQPPSMSHLLGTDDLGRDVLSRVIWGSRISLSVGLISVGIGFFIGVSVGLSAGYLGGKFDLFVMRGIDALLAFPALVLAIAITAALGPQIQNAMIAIGIVAIPAYARLTRGQTLAIRSRDFILAEAALSFLGLGPQPPDPSWGQDVAYSTRYLSNMKWWMSVGPGLAIFSAVFAFNFLGDALRDALDPRLRRSG